MTMTTSQSLYAILPIIVVAITGIIVLLGDACFHFWRRLQALSGNVTLLGLGTAAVLSMLRLGQGNAGVSAFGGAVAADGFAQACNLVLLTSASIAALLALTYLENRRLNLGEYYALVLFSTAGAMLMASAQDLIVVFVAIELLSVALYVLTGFARTEQKSEEAALKYFLLGAFAAGFLLYGIALVYGGGAINNGQGGTTNLLTLAHNLRVVGAPSVMLMAGVALILVGLGFKAALVPFHMWTPDVYEGAPTSVTAYMAAAAKIGAFAALLRVFNALIPIAPYWLTAIQTLAILTMFVGNLLAVTQDNVKRLLAYSSIAHAGYIAVAISAMTSIRAHDQALQAAIFYLLAYTLMTMGAFGVLIYLTRSGKDYQTLGDLRGLIHKDPPSAYLMLIFLLSLGGIPPTMGFMGKWLLFNATLQAGQTGLALSLALASIISLGYYLRVVYVICFEEPTEAETVQEHAREPLGVTLALGVAVAFTLICGVAPGLLRPLMTAATSLLRP